LKAAPAAQGLPALSRCEQLAAAARSAAAHGRSQADAWLSRIAFMLLAGILCFSGGIYLMLAGAPRALGLVTPLGGMLLIGAWALLAWRLHRMAGLPRG
jgi:uncharacterized membrane protein YgdD (TMEM256/DUF423 family)